MAQQTLAKLSGVSQPTISDIETDKIGATAAAPALAQVLNVSALWLASGKGRAEPTAAEIAATHGVSMGDAHYVDSRRYARIPSLEAYDPLAGCLYLSREWLRWQLRPAPPIDTLRAHSAANDAMAPLINFGDLLLIDTSPHSPPWKPLCFPAWPRTKSKSFDLDQTISCY